VAECTHFNTPGTKMRVFKMSLWRTVQKVPLPSNKTQHPAYWWGPPTQAKQSNSLERKAMIEET